MLKEMIFKIKSTHEAIWKSNYLDKLSAAGAPSEFAIRAPILGGVCTVMIEMLDGPNGVFLQVDDQNLTPEIG